MWYPPLASVANMYVNVTLFQVMRCSPLASVGIVYVNVTLFQVMWYPPLASVGIMYVNVTFFQIMWCPLLGLCGYHVCKCYIVLTPKHTLKKKKHERTKETSFQDFLPHSEGEETGKITKSPFVLSNVHKCLWWHLLIWRQKEMDCDSEKDNITS